MDSLKLETEGEEDCVNASPETCSTPASSTRGPMLMEPPRAAAHLEALLTSLESQIGETLPRRSVLVGFSKGAAVLTALLREAPMESDFWAGCESVHMVDPGLSAPKILFDVNLAELKALAGNTPEGFAVWLHSTPRQMQDETRPWMPLEMQAFCEACAEAGVVVERRTYGDGL